MILFVIAFLAVQKPLDFEGILQVETDFAQTVEEFHDVLHKLDQARATGNGPEMAQLRTQGERLDRRLAAERQELAYKTRQLAGTTRARLAETPSDRGWLATHALLMEFAWDANELALALHAVGELLRQDPTHRPTLILRVALLRQSGKLGEATVALSEVLKATPPEPTALTYAGLLAFDRGDATAARLLTDAFKQKDALRPGLAARMDLALRELEIRDRESAIGKDPLPRVELMTAKGVILLELYENEAPNTVANFITLTEKGFYDGTNFHRVEPNFVIQGGDPNTRDNNPKNDGFGGPGYEIADELETGFRRHFRGSLSMAKGDAPNSGGSQFFITHRAAENLDGRHTVFGRVIEGMDVVDHIAAGDSLKSARVIRKRNHPYVVQKN